MELKDQVGLLVEEWKKNVDLHIHHDNLKQQRFRHFITIQAFMFLLLGASIRENANKASVFIGVLSVLAPIIAERLCLLSLRLDKRAKAFTQTVKQNLRFIENKIWHKSRQPIFETYSLQFQILYIGKARFKNNPQTLDVPEVVRSDEKELMTASATEEQILGLFIWFWRAAFFISLLSLIYFNGDEMLNIWKRFAPLSK